MVDVETKIRYLSPSRLRAIFFFGKKQKEIICSYDSRKEVGKEGKALGAIFSSLSRRKFGYDVLIIPFGKNESGHGLRWKLNKRLIKKERLLTLVKELIET